MCPRQARLEIADIFSTSSREAVHALHDRVQAALKGENIWRQRARAKEKERGCSCRARLDVLLETVLATVAV
jgi:hypothetical protein